MPPDVSGSEAARQLKRAVGLRLTVRASAPTAEESTRALSSALPLEGDGGGGRRRLQMLRNWTSLQVVPHPDAEALLVARDAVIATKDAVIAAKNAELAAKDAALESKDAELAAKDATLESKDAELASLRDQLRRCQ